MTAAPARDDVTARLARFLAESRWSDIPQPVRHEAKRALLNWLGCALGGCRDEAVERALAALAEFSLPRQAALLGRRERLDVLNAALINAMSSTALDYDDTHLRTLIHSSAPVAGALLPFVEHRPVPGERLLHAFILGVEAECRIGNAVSPGHYDRGWHITGTCGVFGAAAAVGKLLNLDAQRMAWALSLAATQASGLVEMLGSMARSLHAGTAARNGIVAALLAGKDFESSARGIEAPRGFARVLGAKPDFTAITERLGETWEIMQISYKPYPCGVVLHPVLDGCLELGRNHAPEAIGRIALKVNPLVLARADRKDPRDGHEAKLSVQHCAAIAFVHGAAGVRQFTAACASEPAVAAFRNRVDLEEDAAIARDEAIVTLRMKDGRTFTAHVSHARGSLEHPMSDADLETKFRDLAAAGAPRCNASRLIKAVWSLDKARDASALARLAVPAKSRTR